MDVGVDVCRLWALSVDSSRVTDPRSASRASTSRVVSERASHATRVVTPLAPSLALARARPAARRRSSRRRGIRRRTSFARAFTAASPLARRDDADRWRTRNPSERTALLAPSALARALDRRIDAILEDSSTRTRLVGARRRCRILARRARPDARALVVLLSQSIESCDRRRRGGCERWRDW